MAEQIESGRWILLPFHVGGRTCATTFTVFAGRDTFATGAPSHVASRVNPAMMREEIIMILLVLVFVLVLSFFSSCCS